MSDTKIKGPIAIAADHAGFELKEFLRTNLPDIDWVDLGPSSADRVDYPDYALALVKAVKGGKVAAGILICGSGIGMSIAANRHEGIRAAHAESEAAARLSRQHNNANVLCLGARLTAPEYARDIVNVWFAASFEGGRHVDRLNKIDKGIPLC